MTANIFITISPVQKHIHAPVGQMYKTWHLLAKDNTTCCCVWVCSDHRQGNETEENVLCPGEMNRGVKLSLLQAVEAYRVVKC
jgi:hypothetical protein